MSRSAGAIFEWPVEPAWLGVAQVKRLVERGIFWARKHSRPIPLEDTNARRIP